MKNIIFVLLIVVLSTVVYGQISINNTSFPNVGTTLTSFSLSNTGSITQGPAGENKTWNFNSLSGGQPVVEKYVSPSEGKYPDSFPDANLLIISSQQDFGEIYAKSLNSRIEVVGFGGENPFFGGELAITYTKRPMLRRSPMYYETSAFSEGSFHLAFSTDVLPDSLLNSLPPQLQPDSIRVTTSSIKHDTIDAWGKLQLKNKEFEVLREKSVIITSNKVEIKIPFLGWIDLATILGGGGLPGGFPGFGNDTSTVYNFFTNTRKDILVSITANINGEVVLVNYADIDNTINTHDFGLNVHNTLFPNPVNDRLAFQNDVLPSGEYACQILSIDGKVISESTVHFTQSEALGFSTNNLQNGLYYLVLYPKKGTQIIRASFVVNR